MFQCLGITTATTTTTITIAHAVTLVAMDTNLATSTLVTEDVMFSHCFFYFIFINFLLSHKPRVDRN